MQTDEVEYEVANFRQKDIVSPYKQKRARAAFALSALCIHLDVNVKARYVPFIGKIMEREHCLELASVVSVRFKIRTDMNDQAVRHL